jgi:hypothetical protein
MACKIITQKRIKTPNVIQEKVAIIVGYNTSVYNWCGAGESAQEFEMSEFERSCPQRQ